MLEIVALYFLIKEIGRLAYSKGLHAGKWKVYTILAWITGEFFGAVIGVFFFGTNNLVSIALVAIAGAFTGYVFVKSLLNKQPNQMQNNIDNIGQQ